MLKDQTPEQRLQEIVQTLVKLMPIVGFSSMALFFILYDFRNGTIPNGDLSLLAFLFGAVVVAQVLAFIMLLPLSAWVARVEMRRAVGTYAKPEDHPETVQRLLDGWWSHELSVKTFLVVSQVTFCVCAYRLFGPMLGIL